MPPSGAQPGLDVVLRRFDSPDEVREMAKGRLVLAGAATLHFLGADHYAKP